MKKKDSFKLYILLVASLYNKEKIIRGDVRMLLPPSTGWENLVQQNPAVMNQV